MGAHSEWNIISPRRRRSVVLISIHPSGSVGVLEAALLTSNYSHEGTLSDGVRLFHQGTEEDNTRAIAGGVENDNVNSSEVSEQHTVEYGAEDNEPSRIWAAVMEVDYEGFAFTGLVIGWSSQFHLTPNCWEFQLDQLHEEEKALSRIAGIDPGRTEYTDPEIEENKYPFDAIPFLEEFEDMLRAGA